MSIFSTQGLAKKLDAVHLAIDTASAVVSAPAPSDGPAQVSRRVDCPVPRAGPVKVPKTFQRNIVRCAHCGTGGDYLPLCHDARRSC